MSSDLVVTSRPLLTGRIANITAAVVFVIFVIIAIVMPHANAGATFGWKDQIFTVVVGAIVAGGLRLPARPRLRADAEAVHMRSYLGNYRSVPWDAVVAVQFPSNARFARLVLPGDEILALYAVQRADGDHAVGVMRGLRQLFAETHPIAT
ncbi:MAG TPA: PH domain-containing protein [Jatrophihabitans sp.]|nr:PH domain-containing protein [Jatrophihabitans sp.]